MKQGQRKKLASNIGIYAWYNESHKDGENRVCIGEFTVEDGYTQEQVDKAGELRIKQEIGKKGNVQPVILKCWSFPKNLFPNPAKGSHFDSDIHTVLNKYMVEGEWAEGIDANDIEYIVNNEYVKNLKKFYKGKKKVVNLYKDQQETIDFCVENLSSGKIVLGDLCTRYGKTHTMLSLLNSEKNKNRVMTIDAYVGTVNASYADTINSCVNYENILFIDPDVYTNNEAKDVVKIIKDICTEWLEKDPNNKLVYYYAITGDDKKASKDSKIAVRKKIRKWLIDNYDVFDVIEEADFGACCDKQIEKIATV